jgi:phage regulator Rha-like protein
MLDRDLAEMYQVPTKSLNLKVKRNIDRFPDDFMFQLKMEEFDILRFQNETSSWGGTRYLPYAFTEQGVAMLSSVLNSEVAINVNIRIIRLFTKLREMLMTNKDMLLRMEKIERELASQGDSIEIVFNYLDQFMQEQKRVKDEKPREKIGFKHPKEQ